MNLYELFTEQELRSQIDLKMVKATTHPKLPLTILNYTQQATFNPENWNHVTDLCRGIIYDNRSMEIVSRPFSKFWNYGDTRHPETLTENLPSTPPTITRKMDGSLGIAYQTPNGWAIATRGSFSSDQAFWASRWISEHSMRVFVEGYTPLFEIIYPENQIVVKYPWSGLILLAMVNIKTGEELDRKQLEHFAAANNYEVVEQFNKPLSALVGEDTPNEEGYVVSWPRIGTSPLRCKVKYSTYCRLHKLLTQTSAVTIWEMLRDGSDIAALTVDVPKEFKVWVEIVQSRLKSSYEEIESKAMLAMAKYDGKVHDLTPDERKQFALYAVKQNPVTPILFAMLDRKEYAPIIWKMIRPDGARENPFKVDDDL